MDMCRLCLGPGANDNIYQNGGFLTSRIILCCRLQPQFDDGLPSAICTSCQISLDHIWNFQALCHESDQKLRASLPLNKFKSGVEMPVKVEMASSGHESDESEEIRNYTHENRPNNDEIDIEDVKIEVESIENERKLKKKSDLIKRRRKRSVPKHECDYCHKRFRDKPRVVTHILSKHPSNDVKCQICEKAIDRRSMKNHMNTHCNSHNTSPKRISKPADYRLQWKHICHICKKTFHDQITLILHFRSRHRREIDPSLCWVCRESVSTGNITEHLQTHPEILIPCEKCNQKFMDLISLNKHMVTHAVKVSSDLKYPCDHCGKLLKTIKSFRLHMKNLHTAPYRRKCEICHRYLSTKLSYEGHMKLHTGEKNLQCDICGEKFLRKSSIRIHIMMHNNYRPYGCKYCNQSFTTSKNLNDHVRLHTGEKPFLCSQCGKGFAQKCNMMSHIRHNHKYEGGAYLNRSNSSQLIRN